MKILRYKILILVMALVPFGAWADDLTITTEAELRDFAAKVNDGTYNDADQYIYLANDISLTADWTPIGTAEHPFKGHFEGWGHTVSGLTTTGSNNHQGLFGYVAGGSIRDVAVSSGTISGGQYLGAICGYLAASSEISSCYSAASVTGTAYVGGICGYSDGTIKHCYVTGTVTSTATPNAFAGGIAGHVAGTLQYSYMAGTMSVSGIYYYGGIVGYKAGQANVACCIYNADNITATAIGGDDGTYGSAADDPTRHVTRQTTEVMQDEKFWKGTRDGDEDFVLNEEAETMSNTVWKITGDSYPLLYSFLKNEPFTLNFTGKTC